MSFSPERSKRMVERVLLDLVELPVTRGCLSAPLGNDYPVVSRPHESMEGESLFSESAFGTLSCNMQNQFSSAMSQFTATVESTP